MSITVKNVLLLKRIQFSFCCLVLRELLKSHNPLLSLNNSPPKIEFVLGVPYICSSGTSRVWLFLTDLQARYSFQFFSLVEDLVMSNFFVLKIIFLCRNCLHLCSFFLLSSLLICVTSAPANIAKNLCRLLMCGLVVSLYM